MPSRGLHGLWLRGVAAVAACLLALASTGALVAAAVVAPEGQGPAVTLTSQGRSDANSGDDHSNGTGVAHGAPADFKPAPPEPKIHEPNPTPAEHPKPAPKPAGRPTPPRQIIPAHVAAPAAPVPTAGVVVDSTDPAPFSAQAVAATDATRVLPIERLGPLSGISFGSGLFIWPLLLAVDVVSLAVIARMALRRRLASPED